jgi:hypothetical protein
MVGLETTDNKLVGIAVGQENDNYWYVQTTPLPSIVDTDLFEHIQELLESKEHALAIAKLYIDKYGFKLFEWA